MPPGRFIQEPRPMNARRVEHGLSPARLQKNPSAAHLDLGIHLIFRVINDPALMGVSLKNCNIFPLALNHWKNMKDTKSLKKNKEGNYFNRLPAELIISIFERIVDAKCLCICYSVSKYFAAHVVQTRFVSVEIPYSVDYTRSTAIWPPGAINFLRKLRCVESAIIQFCFRIHLNPGRSQPLVWGNCSTLGFIFVCHDNTSKRRLKTGAFFSSIRNHLHDYLSRLCYIQDLLFVVRNLKHISVVDSLKQGSFVVEGEWIARIKGYIDHGEVSSKLWIVRKLKLPFSGRVMKNVGLLLGSYDGLIAENLLEENEYHEVAMTMMKKPDYTEI